MRGLELCMPALPVQQRWQVCKLKELRGRDFSQVGAPAGAACPRRAGLARQRLHAGLGLELPALLQVRCNGDHTASCCHTLPNTAVVQGQPWPGRRW